MFVEEKLKHFAVTHSLNFYQDELDPAERTKERGGERRAELRRSARRQQLIIKVSSQAVL